MDRSVSFRASGMLCLAIVVWGLAQSQATPSAAASAPLRTFWVAQSALDSPEAVRRTVASITAGSFDTAMVPIALGAEVSPGFDGPREMLKEARDRGLRVHAWIQVTLASLVGELPASRDHVLYQHPEWLMVPREIAPEILKIDPRSPAYVGDLTRWVRLNTPRSEGLYVSPLDPEAATYLVNAVTTVVKRYSVDGVFLDAVRFPGSDFDYSRHAMEIFRADTRPHLTLDERARMDEIEAIDPFGYAEEFPEQWRQFRQSRLTTLMSRLRKALASVSPTFVVSAGITSEPEAALAESFQDWQTWMGTGLVDGIGRRSGPIVFTADGLSATALPSSATPDSGAATR